MRHQNPAAWCAGELVRKQVRVLDAKSRQHRRELVGASVAVGVFVKANLAIILHERAVFVRQQAERNRQTFGEGPRFLAAQDGRRVEHQCAVTPAAGEERLRLGWRFVGVERILERRHCPQAAGVVEGDRDELAAVGLGGDEFDLEASREAEGGEFFFGR